MQELSKKINKTRSTLFSYLAKAKAQGKVVAGYGAPAKATTLMYALGLNPLVDYIVDDSPLKQGKFMPGSHIPIVSDKDLYEKQPDYLVILAWNFADPIMEKVKQKGFKGQCIVPFP